MLLDGIGGVTQGVRDVMGGLRAAASATGASFKYLLTTAQRESSLNPTAKAQTSSATGLFQFVKQTWLESVKMDGARFGRPDLAEAITRTPDGRFTVSDPAKQQEILALRNDPTMASFMAAGFTERNAASLNVGLGRAPTEGELYIAHFLGAAGARDFIASREAAPDAAAAAFFPAAAKANRSIFYERDGSARSLDAVYARLTAAHGDTPVAVSRSMPASSPVSAITEMGFERVIGGPLARTGITPIGHVTAFAEEPAAGDVPSPYSQDDVLVPAEVDEGAVFHGLFKPGRRRPVSAYVDAVWAGNASPMATAGAKTAVSGDMLPRRIGAPLDLSLFMRGGLAGSASASVSLPDRS